MRSMSGSAGIGDGLLLARDAGAEGHQIHRNRFGILGHQLQTPLGRGGRGEKHRIEPSLAHHLDVIAGLFDTRVREQAAIDAGRPGVPRQFFKTIAEHRVQIREKQQRNLRTFANLRRDVENFRQRGPGRQCAVAGLLDYGAVRDGGPKNAHARARSDRRRRVRAPE